MRASLILNILFAAMTSQAFASSFFVYEGYLTDSAGTPVGGTGSTNVPFILEIRGKNSTLGTSCTLYQETRTVSVDQGNFAITVGKGADTTSPATAEAFSNALSSRPVTVGSCTFDPTHSDAYRVLHVTVNSEPLGEMTLGDSPRAVTAGNADQLEGLKSETFFRVIDGSTPGALTPWSSANYEKLKNLVSSVSVSSGTTSITGTSSGFTGSLGGDVSGAQATTRVNRLQGRDVYDVNPGNGQVLQWNNANTRWEPASLPTAANPTWNEIADKPTSFAPGGNAGGDLASTYPNPTIKSGAVTPAKLQAGSSAGQSLRYSGTAWSIEKLRYTDLVNSHALSPWPTTACAANEAVKWSSISDAFECSSVSISETDPQVGANALNMLSKWDGSALIASAIYENSGNVGIGNASPTEKLDVAGKIKGSQLCIGSDCRSSWPTSNSGTVTSITAGTGLTGGTITGSGTIGLGAELTGLNALNANGFIKRTAAGTYSTATALDLGTETTGTLSLARGGTGATTQSAALNNLLPTQASNNGKFLQTDGSQASWVTIPGGTVTSVSVTAPLTVTSPTTTPSLSITGGGITSAHLALSAVGSSQLAASAVTSAKILDGTIATADIADAQITDIKIVSVDASKLTGTIAQARLPALVCPAGFDSVIPPQGTAFCVTTASYGPASFLDSSIGCAQSGADLCSPGELAWACAGSKISLGTHFWSSVSSSSYAVYFKGTACASTGSFASDSATLTKNYHCCRR